MNSVIRKLLKSGLLDQDQIERVQHMLNIGYQFHSYFKDGSIELIDVDDRTVIYVERNGDIAE